MNSKITAVVNPYDKSWCKPYVFSFGVYGWVILLAYGDSLQYALDECIDWVADNAPGLLCNDEVAEAYEDAVSRGLSEDAAYEESLADVTTGGNCGDHILSWEWSLIAEHPTPKQIADIHHGR